MLSIIPYITVNPYFQVTQIYTPPSGNSNQYLYNTTNLQYLDLLVLPSGGKYKIEFNTNTLISITLDRILVQLINYGTYTPNQDNFSLRHHDGFFQNYNAQTGSLTYNVNRSEVERLYVYGDSLIIDTTIIPNTYVVTVSLPTYIPLASDINGYFPNLGNVTYVYPSTSFMTSTESIPPQNLEVNTLYGIKFTVGVSQTYTPCYNIYPFTSVYDIPDIYGNDIEFTVNDTSLPNSILTSLPKIPYDFVPIYGAGYINTNSPIPMTLGGDYDYIGFSNYGSADGIMTQNPVLFYEKVQLVEIHNNKTYLWSYGSASLISFRGTENGIKPYGVQLSVGQVPGTNILANYSQNISTTNNVSETLISNAQILLTVVKSNGF